VKDGVGFAIKPLPRCTNLEKYEGTIFFYDIGGRHERDVGALTQYCPPSLCSRPIREPIYD